MLPTNTKKVQFNVQDIYPVRRGDSMSLLVQQYSFWVAALSIFSFIIGNLVGQHGWYAVYKSVLGGGLEQQIVFTGAIAPVDKVPNYVAWAQYGGDPHDNTYRQVPSRILVDLPAYSASIQNDASYTSPIGQIYSVGYNGSYATGGDGDGYHSGIDIRIPIGTPIRSIANGIVIVAEEKNGFGNTIVVKHPNVPDPEKPSKTTTLYSVYAHLSSIHVRIDDVVSKGNLIGLSGNSGNSSGPHLHFQIDRDSAPWHPYWPANNSKALSELHTMNPMNFVQTAFSTVVVANTNKTTNVRTTTVSRRAAPTRVSLLNSAAQKKADRLASRTTATTVAIANPKPIVETSTVITVAKPILDEKSVLGTTSVSAAKTIVAKVDIRHDGQFKPRQFEVIRIRLLDEEDNRIKDPILPRGIYLKAAYGEADFDKPILKESDFIDGEAIVRMRSNSNRTIVISVEPFGTLSKPLTLEK